MNNSSAINYRNPAEIRAKGFEALSNALGTIGTIYFLRQFSGGSGNWTEDRKSILGNITEQDFEEELAALRKTPFIER
jgi:hypothetical protein